MPKTKLTNYMRAALTKHAERLLTPDPITPEYLAARDAVFDAVLNRYPAKDMAVLKKYDATEPAVYARAVWASETKLVDPNGTVHAFRLADGDHTAPPSRPKSQSCAVIPCTADQAAALVAHAEKATEAQDYISRRMDDYKALIQASRYLEEVTEVWADAADLALGPTRTALTTISPELRWRIADDVTLRRAARDEAEAGAI